MSDSIDVSGDRALLEAAAGRAKVDGVMKLAASMANAETAMLVNAGGRSFYDAQESRNKDRDALRAAVTEICDDNKRLRDALRDVIGWVPGGHWHTDAPIKAVERARAALGASLPA